MLFELCMGIPEFLDSGRKWWTLDSDAGLRALESGRWNLGVGIWMLDSGRWALDAGLWTLDTGLCTLDSGRWTQDPGPWTLDSGHYTLDAGLWTLETTIDCFRAKSEPSFWLCLIKLLKLLWVRVSNDLMARLFCSDYRLRHDYF